MSPRRPCRQGSHSRSPQGRLGKGCGPGPEQPAPPNTAFSCCRPSLTQARTSSGRRRPAKDSGREPEARAVHTRVGKACVTRPRAWVWALVSLATGLRLSEPVSLLAGGGGAGIRRQRRGQCPYPPLCPSLSCPGNGSVIAAPGVGTGGIYQGMSVPRVPCRLISIGWDTQTVSIKLKRDPVPAPLDSPHPTAWPHHVTHLPPAPQEHSDPVPPSGPLHALCPLPRMFCLHLLIGSSLPFFCAKYQLIPKATADPGPLCALPPPLPCSRPLSRTNLRSPSFRARLTWPSGTCGPG